jgi:integrase
MPTARFDPPIDAASLFARNGQRKYLNADERMRLLAVTETLEPAERLFVLMLFYTGARISEVLNLARVSANLGDLSVAVVTLKRRSFSVRELPLPDRLVAELDQTFQITAAQQSDDQSVALRRMWPWSRTTGYRVVKAAMAAARIAGLQACPKGLRHGFGVAAIRAGVPVTILQKWMGHASIRTTAIYTAICGPEEREFAAKLWHNVARSVAGQQADLSAVPISSKRFSCRPTMRSRKPERVSFVAAP